MIYFSPLQGLTDCNFRNAHFHVCGGVDKYFAPYISLVQKSVIQKRKKRDIDPMNQAEGIPLVPQIMGIDAPEIVLLIKELQELGYNEINWNLGCPYPMVTKRGCGAGAIANLDSIASVLVAVFENTSVDFSVKMRLGEVSSDEFLMVKPLLSQYPLKELIVHPRTAKQYYADRADRAFFAEHCIGMPFPAVYNGDVKTSDDGKLLLAEYPTIALGRGAVANPMLPMIVQSKEKIEYNKLHTIFWDFHACLYDGVARRMDGGDAQVTRKMYEYWQYWGDIFPESGKELKRLKKCSRRAVYEELIHRMERNATIVF